MALHSICIFEAMHCFIACYNNSSTMMDLNKRSVFGDQPMHSECVAQDTWLLYV